MDDEYRSSLNYRPSEMEYSNGLVYAIINGDVLGKNSSIDIEKEVLKLAHRFHKEEITDDEGVALSVGRIPRSHLCELKHNAQPLHHSTEIIVLFTRPAWRHTEFEHILYDAFIKFGAITDDVLVRILYPSHISDEYTKRVAEYNILRLPAAIFHHKRTGRLVAKVERDFFESIPDISERVSFVISDIHRAIAAGHTTMARRMIKELMAKDSGQTLALEELKTATGKVIFQLQPKNAFVIHKMKGDIVAGDKVKGNTIHDYSPKNKKR